MFLILVTTNYANNSHRQRTITINESFDLQIKEYRHPSFNVHLSILLNEIKWNDNPTGMTGINLRTCSTYLKKKYE